MAVFLRTSGTITGHDDHYVNVDHVHELRVVQIDSSYWIKVYMRGSIPTGTSETYSLPGPFATQAAAEIALGQLAEALGRIDTSIYVP